MNKGGKKQKKQNAALINIAILIVLLFIIIIAFFMFYSDVLVARTRTLTSDETALKTTYDVTKTKVDGLGNLQNEITQLIADLSGSRDAYYADVPQEKIIYVLNELKNASNLSFKKIDFNESDTLFSQKDLLEDFAKNAAIANPEVATEPTADGSEVEAVKPADEVEINEINMDVNSLQVSISFSGKIDELRKFLQLVDNNNKIIAINTLTLKTEETLINYLKNKFAVEPKPNIGETLEQYKTRIEEEARESIKIVNGDIVLNFIRVPSISKYETQEELYNWNLKDSMNNPFDFFDFLEEITIKESIFLFESEVKKPILENITEDKVTLEQQEYDNRRTAELRYSFDNQTENPRIYMNLADNGITIVKPATGIGLEVYSAMSNNANMLISITDANNVQSYVELAKTIYWKGWSTLNMKLPENLAYPVKINGILIQQTEKSKEPENGTLRFEQLFVSRIVPDATSEETTTTP